MEAEMLNLECFEEELRTPMKAECAVLTPRQSERKRALFPSASPQSSDLGPMSPLSSSPENSPVRRYDATPNPVRRMSKSPYASSIQSKAPLTPIENKGTHTRFAPLGSTTPIQECIQTDLSTLKNNLNEVTPHRTPLATPSESRFTQSELKPCQPVTPSKKRSKSLGAMDTSESPGRISERHSFDSRSRSSDSPKARTSLFNDGRLKASKRKNLDDVYLTGRSNKRHRVYGEINKGVRTGIKRPIKKKTPPNKPSSKPQASKIKSVWEVGPTSKKKKLDPLLAYSIFPMFSNKKTPQAQTASQSASSKLLEIARQEKRKIQEEEPEETEVEVREPTPEPDPNKRFFKTNRTLGINRKATVTVTKGVKLVVSNGNFQLNTVKKRRKLFHHKHDPGFEEGDEDPVINKSRECVNTILKTLEKDEEKTPPVGEISIKSGSDKLLHLRPPLLPTPRDHSPPRRFPEMPSPILSPLSALASSTSTLSLNLHKESTAQPLTTTPSTKSILPSVLMEDDESTSSQGSKGNSPCGLKLFPIFNRETQLSDITNKPEKTEKKITWKPIGDDQYQIDAGQKHFGATECGVCGLVYQIGDPEDEIRHNQFHSKIFSHTGWKNERIVYEAEHAYISLVLPSDSKVWWDRVAQVLKTVDEELGYANIGIRDPDSTKVFLYIFKKQIVGCLLAESISTAYRMLISEEETGGVDCCSEEEYPVVCGISRLWVHRFYRRRNIAFQLTETMRRHFSLGKLLSVDDFAFSSPTLDGKRFAAKYTNRSDYLVYM